jgi:hypothetical protein
VHLADGHTFWSHRSDLIVREVDAFVC